MRIAVLGAGGVGGYFGARLAADGNDVTFIARGAHAAAMRAQGLKVRSPVGDLDLQPVKLHDDWRTTGLVDIVLVTVKMYDLADVAAIIKPLLAIDTAVVPFQNGVEAQAILEQALGRRYVCGGAAYIAATIEAPGAIRHTGKGARIVFGEPYESQSWRLATLEAACRGAGVDAVLSPAINVEVWKKFVFLAPFASVTCLGRTTIGAVREDPLLWRQFLAMVDEATAVARARGVDLPEGTEAERVELARKLPTDMKSSMLHDLEAGRRLELDWLTGAVVRLGAEAGVATPATAETYDALAPLRAAAGHQPAT